MRLVPAVLATAALGASLALWSALAPPVAPPGTPAELGLRVPRDTGPRDWAEIVIEPAEVAETRLDASSFAAEPDGGPPRFGGIVVDVDTSQPLEGVAAPLNMRFTYPDGDPLPWCPFEIADAAGSRGRVTSASDGRASRPLVELGEVVATSLVEFPTLADPILTSFMHAGVAEVVIPVDAPATVLFRPPPEPATPEAFLVLPDHPHLRMDTETAASPSGDGRLWARCNVPPEVARSLAGPWTIELRHPQWRAEVEVTALEGVLELEPAWRKLGSLEIVAHCDLVPVPEYELTIDVDRDDGFAGLDTSVVLAEWAAQPIRFDAVEPGEVVVTIRDGFCGSRAVACRIEPGETARVPIEVECLPQAGWIEVRVATRSGRPPPVELLARLWDHDDSLDPDATDWFTAQDPVPPSAEPGRGLDIVRFGPLPRRRYGVCVDAGLWRVEPESCIVEPGRAVELTIVDDVPAARVTAVALDDATGEPLEGASVELGPRPYRLYAGHGGQATLHGVPLGAKLVVYAGAPGYRSRIEDVRFDATRLRSDGEARIEVRLLPGWNAFVHAYDRASDEPIAGAALLADGVEVARTNADGFAEVVLDRAPQALEALHGGAPLEGGQTPERRYCQYAFSR